MDLRGLVHTKVDHKGPYFDGIYMPILAIRGTFQGMHSTSCSVRSSLANGELDGDGQADGSKLLRIYRIHFL